jgi:hypothetical protein
VEKGQRERGREGKIKTKRFEESEKNETTGTKTNKGKNKK